MIKIRSSEITSESQYVNRREFLKSAGIVTGSAALLAACGVNNLPNENGGDAEFSNGVGPVASADTDEWGDPLTPYEAVTGYNNYYEFSTDKYEVARLSKGFVTSPWEVQVTGMVNNPKTYSIDDLKKFEIEERIYRMRCVEAWSMVIPWNGFQLSKLLDDVQPTSDAMYVRFETAELPDQMPGLNNPFYEWPYVEGLRLDEAMNPLAILATGVYGNDLPPQNGAPVRLVVPWKYGLKGIKSIVKIELTDTMPISLWNEAAPSEYGFYSNVNPNVSHPRWSQATERRIGENDRRATHMFNGYEEEVAYLYEGMDLGKYF